MERRGYVELGRGMRHLCHLQSPGYGRLSTVPGGKQEGGLRPTGLRGRLGRVQPLVSLLLHVALGQAEQSLPAVPAGVVYTTNGEVILTTGFASTIILSSRNRAFPISMLDHSISPLRKPSTDFGKRYISHLTSYFMQTEILFYSKIYIKE